ncbi:MAG: hypothetical protein K2M08_00220 [Anaeroplasmataceae bacterium]|nr:hypothetical protein [Anaeroplasmataceae bacterium]
MKKIFILLFIGILVLTGCSSKIKMTEIPFVEAKELFQKYDEIIEHETEEQVYFNHLYYEEESLEIDDNAKSITTEIIYVQLDTPFYHSETKNETKGVVDISSLFQIDAFVKENQLYYFQTMLFGERVFTKKYFICPIDYIYSTEIFGHLFEENLYEYFLSRLQRNLNMELHEGEISFMNSCIQKKYGIMYNHQKGIQVLRNEEMDLTTLKLSYFVDEESKENNLCINSSVTLKGHYMIEKHETYYNKEYTTKRYDYEKTMEIPDLNIEEYEEVDPTLPVCFWISY